MTLTTTERLTVDGVDLKTWAKNVSTLGAMLHAPARRGSVAVVAGKSGSLRRGYRPYEEASYVWPMWVRGCDDNGAIPGGSTARIEFYKRVDELTRLFTKDSGLLDVRHILPDGTIRQATLEVRSIIDFTTFGYSPLGKFQVELVNPDSFWQDVSTNSVTDVTSALTVNFGSGGTAPIEDAVITLTGAISSPVFTDAFGGAVATYAKALTAGHSLVLNCGTSQVTVAGGHVLDMTKLTLSNSNGRLMRFSPDSVNGGYRLVVTGTGISGATINVVSRRKYLVG